MIQEKIKTDKEASIVTSEGELKKILEKASSEQVCAIDTEANSLYSYKESLCLIQFAWADRSLLIDPLAINDLSPLTEYLSSRTVWMHGADYDMTMLLRTFGKLPERVFDTQIGARLLGLRKFGLGNLVQHYFDVELNKSSQKADWGRRPLTDKMLSYALDDVRYLLPMAKKIMQRLEELERIDWFYESCKQAEERVVERESREEEEPWRIRGSGTLSSKGLHYLKNLWEWREDEGKQWGKPVFMVLPNKRLLNWAANLAEGKRVEWPSHYRTKRVRNLIHTVEQAHKAAANTYPERRKKKRSIRNPELDKQVEELIEKRNQVAKKLELEGSVIASRHALEDYVRNSHSNAGQSTPELMQWQRECLQIV